MKIIDFFKAFKNAYSTINKNKIKAKSILHYKRLTLNTLERQLDQIHKAIKYLQDVYFLLDKNERQDCVQKTLDLLNYGPIINGSRSYSEYYIYQYTSKIKDIKHDIQEIKKLMRKGKYEEIISIYTE